jgi:methionyl-tRNA formyltransferase
MGITPPPVKQVAVELGLAVFQPQRIREVAAIERIRNLGPAALIVAAYGQILPLELLTVPALGGINLHASLLPRHRGPAPIAWAILSGDEETGVTVMEMDAGVDTGAILAQSRIAIDARETTPELEIKLARLGAELMVETLDRLGRGEVSPVPQPQAGVTLAPRLTSVDGDLDGLTSALEIDRRVRALTPDPGCWITLAGSRVKVLEGSLDGASGEYRIKTVQPPGRRAMPVDAYLRGRR